MPDTPDPEAREARVKDIISEFEADREATSEKQAVLDLARALAWTEASLADATTNLMTRGEAKAALRDIEARALTPAGPEEPREGLCSECGIPSAPGLPSAHTHSSNPFAATPAPDSGAETAEDVDFGEGAPSKPDHEHYWVDAHDDETGWHCTICGVTEYPDPPLYADDDARRIVDAHNSWLATPTRNAQSADPKELDHA